jgi:hypothetical protein
MAQEYVKHLTNDELLERMADELVNMHKGKFIDLLYWETAFEITERFYETNSVITFRRKENKSE